MRTIVLVWVALIALPLVIFFGEVGVFLIVKYWSIALVIGGIATVDFVRWRNRRRRERDAAILAATPQEVMKGGA